MYYFNKLKAYGRLARIDKPIGVLLLWYPTAYSLWFANKGMPHFTLLWLFGLGTFFMRSAGCVVNDIVDRNIDLHVARTKHRPLTSGDVSLVEAIIVLLVFLFAALVVLLNLPKNCLPYAVIAVAITAAYPFCKRYIEAPQVVLGLAFSMGIPIAYCASGQLLNSDTLLLWVINFFWIIAYDTQYAISDSIDDARIGVKSTALYFGCYSRKIIALLQVFFHSCWLFAVSKMSLPGEFVVFWCMGAALLGYQQWLLKRRERSFDAFLNNNWYGLIMWVGLIASI